MVSSYQPNRGPVNLEILHSFLQNWDEILIKISANLHDRRHKKETNILTLKGHFLQSGRHFLKKFLHTLRANPWWRVAYLYIHLFNMHGSAPPIENTFRRHCSRMFLITVLLKDD